jgi:hypothetical protein
METDPSRIEEYAKAMYPATTGGPKLKVEMGDMNMSMIRTAKGRMILVQHDVTTPGLTAHQPHRRDARTPPGGLHFRRTLRGRSAWGSLTKCREARRLLQRRKDRAGAL